MLTFLVIGGVLMLVAGGSGKGYSYGGPPLRKGISREPTRLLPGFARKLDRVFKRMRARGFDPILWEGWRTNERALRLANKGSGIVRSMHTLGAAVDIVDRRHLWDASPAFWKALGEETAREGLVWGGHWRKADKPHVQGITVADQNAFRVASVADRKRWVA